MTGLQLIARERKEQITKHKRTPAGDKKYNNRRQLRVAAYNLIGDQSFIQEPPDGWDKKLWKRMAKKTVKERLIIAGALIAAELDRIQK